jgi:hypothetical protein
MVKLSKVVWVVACVYVEHDLDKIGILMLCMEREQRIMPKLPKGAYAL